MPNAGSTISAIHSDDVTHLHESALAHGLDTALISNRVLLAGPSRGTAELCIARGVVSDTSQAAAAFLEEQDVIRQLLRAQGVPVPRSRTLRFTDAYSFVLNQIETLGLPLVLRPAWNSRVTVKAVDEPGCADAIDRLRTLAGRTGTRPGKPHSRFMAEQPAGEVEVRVLVAYEEVIASTVSTSEQSGEMPTNVHSDLHHLALRAASAVPDLAVATVRITVEDPTRPLDSQLHAVVRMGAAPRLSSFDRLDPGMAARLADLILERQPRVLPVPSGERRTHRAATIDVVGLPGPEAGEVALREYLTKSKALRSRCVRLEDSQLRAEVTGSPRALARFADAIITGQIGGQRPLRVDLSQTASEAKAG